MARRETVLYITRDITLSAENAARMDTVLYITRYYHVVCTECGKDGDGTLYYEIISRCLQRVWQGGRRYFILRDNITLSAESVARRETVLYITR